MSGDMTLRVAHVLNAPGRGGVPHVAAALIRHADRSRIAPHLYYLKGGDGPDLSGGLDVPSQHGTGGKSGAMIGLMNWLETHRIDILHSHSYRPNLYARMAGAALRPAGLKIVAHYHNDYSDKWADPAILCAERRLARVTDAAIAVSEAVARHVVQHVPGLPPIEVVENGIDRERLTEPASREATRAQLGLTPGDVAIGLIGRVCRQKGVDIFVDAALALAPRHPAARFLVIGDTEDRALHERLTSRITDAGQSHVISFTGYRRDMAAILSALDLVAAPSRWEGFGLALAEAMVSGVPVVASRVGGIPSVVGDAARLVEPESPATLEAALNDLISDPSMRSEMAARGRVQARRFDWSRAAEQVETLYHHISGLK